MVDFNLSPSERADLLSYTLIQLEHYYSNTRDFKTSLLYELPDVREYVRSVGFDQPKAAQIAVQHVIEGLQDFSVHTPHPKYFGLFNPRIPFPGILSDLITSVFNPQLAAWSHAPFAAEVERYLIQEFGKKFGYEAETINGTFATGGAEANLTALLCAINQRFPEFLTHGFLGMTKRPMIYCSAEAHHSINKAAKMVGLGVSSVRSIPARQNLSMNPDALEAALKEDLKNGKQPLMLVGTAGTTGSGAIDDLVVLGRLAKRNNIWFHVDAAWGGAAILSKALRPALAGIEGSNSITFDAHKWLSMPMGTSMFLTSNPNILNKAFRITADYMPKESKEIVDPFANSVQWSRRAIGLKLYLSLLIFGWEGYEAVIDQQAALGQYLKTRLQAQGWEVLNNTPLPVVCFTDSSHRQDNSFATYISETLVSEGTSWVSVYPIHGISCIRACITNFSTTEEDINALVQEVNLARDRFINT